MLSHIYRTPLLMFWTGDLAHAGAEFRENNLRIHVYIDSPVFPREKGATFPE